MYAVTVVEMDRSKTFISIFIVRVYNADLCLQLSIFQTDSKQTQTRCERAGDVKKRGEIYLHHSANKTVSAHVYSECHIAARKCPRINISVRINT